MYNVQHVHVYFDMYAKIIIHDNTEMRERKKERKKDT